MRRKRGMAKLAQAGMGVGLGLAGRELWVRWRAADLRGQVVLITGGSRGWATSWRASLPARAAASPSVHATRPR